MRHSEGGGELLPSLQPSMLQSHSWAAHWQAPQQAPSTRAWGWCVWGDRTAQWGPTLHSTQPAPPLWTLRPPTSWYISLGFILPGSQEIRRVQVGQWVCQARQTAGNKSWHCVGCSGLLGDITEGRSVLGLTGSPGSPCLRSWEPLAQCLTLQKEEAGCWSVGISKSFKVQCLCFFPSLCGGHPAILYRPPCPSLVPTLMLPY